MDGEMPNTSFVPRGDSLTLSELLGGDEARLLRVLRAFCAMADTELLRLDAVSRDGKADAVAQIANRLATACHLVGEATTGSLLDAVGGSAALDAVDPVMTQRIARARVALIESLARVSVRMEELEDGKRDGAGGGEA